MRARRLFRRAERARYVVARARARAAGAPSIPAPMLRLRQDALPHVGSSHQFVGADQGDVGVSVFLFNGAPGRGPGPHRHPYDEIQFIQSGRGRWTVDGVTFEAGAGDVLVIKAGEVHSFQAIGDEPLVQLDVHVGPRFVQENLPAPDGGRR